MKTLAATVVVLLAAGGAISAHRLDEYLQATRVAIARDGLTLDVDLTPGVSIASTVVGTLDANADGTIVSAEAEAYGRAFLSDFIVTLDGEPVAMTLGRIELPTIDEMRSGMGTIRLRAAGRVEVAAGRHKVNFLNNHRPDTSVYMVNALVPEDRGVDIVSQSRDPRQRAFHVETIVRPHWPMPLLWLGLGGAGLAVIVRNEKRKTKNEKGKRKNE